MLAFVVHGLQMAKALFCQSWVPYNTHQDELVRIEVGQAFLEHLEVGVFLRQAPSLRQGVDHIDLGRELGVVVAQDVEERLPQQRVVLPQYDPHV